VHPFFGSGTVSAHNMQNYTFRVKIRVGDRCFNTVGTQDQGRLSLSIDKCAIFWGY